MRDGVAEFATLVDRAGRLRRDMARYATRERKLREKTLHTLFIARNVRIHLAISSFQVGVRDQCRAAVSGTGHVDHVQVLLANEAVQMDIEEVQTGSGTPVTEQARLYVFLRQRLLKQWVI